MIHRNTSIFAASILFLAGAAASAQTDRMPPRQAIQSAAQLTAMDTNLTDIIAIAEKHTGGIAIGIRLTANLRELNNEHGHENWGSRTGDQETRDGQQSGSRTEPDRRQDAGQTGSRTEQNRRQDAGQTGSRTEQNPRQDAGQTDSRTQPDRRSGSDESNLRSENAPMYAVVTCVVDRSKVRDVYIDLGKSSVAGVRTPYGQDDSGRDARSQVDSDQPRSRQAYGQDDSRQDARSRDEADRSQTRQTFVRASDLMNSTARNMHGEKIGEIDELAIDANSLRVVYGVLRRGGFLGIGESRYAIAVDELRNTTDRRVTIHLEDSDFKDQSGFSRNNWPLQADSRWSRNEGRTTATDATETDTAATRTAVRRITKASDIIGSKVLSSGGETVGNINDLIVVPSTGRIAYAIVETDRGELTIPISSLQVRGKDFTIAKTIEQMQFMPTIRADRDPDWGDENWIRRMNESYGSTTQPRAAGSETRGG